MKKVMFFVVFVLVSSVAHAEWRNGRIMTIYADPSDIVFTLKDGADNDVMGQCGSGFFHIKRSAENFKEHYAMLLTSYAIRAWVNPYTVTCENDRNIVAQTQTVYPQ